MKSPDWDQRFAEAQAVTSYTIAGKEYPRVRYGNETRGFAGWMVDMSQPHPCHDCAVLVGAYHLPGCDAEECPRCGGQSIGCDCDDDDDETWEEQQE